MLERHGDGLLVKINATTRSQTLSSIKGAGFIGDINIPPFIVAAIACDSYGGVDC